MLRPKWIYITSAKHPEELYCALEERTEGSVAQLLRRITEIIKIGGPEVPYPPFAAIFSAGGGSNPSPVVSLAPPPLSLRTILEEEEVPVELSPEELSLQLDDCFQSTEP